MPGDVGPYQAQWNLRPRIDAIRAEAKSLRQQNNENYKTKETELAITRDRLAREQYGVEQQAKSADIQVGVENKEVQRIADGIAKREAGLAAAEKRGDTAKAQEDREDIAAWRGEQATHEARARQATLDAAELREQAAGIDRQRVELSVERGDLSGKAGKIETEIDKMEQQADMLQQARLKYAEADMATDVGKRATLELEAEAMVTKASAIEIDRSIIRTVIPELPETTPGIDDDPGPLPAGSEDVSSTGNSEDDDVASADPESTGASEGGESNAAPTSSSANMLDDEMFDTAGGNSVDTSASGASFSGSEFGDDIGFGSGTETTGDDGQSGFDSTLIEEPAVAALADTTGFEDPSGYESPAYEEPYVDPVAAVEDSYGGGDFAAPAEAEVSYADASYDTESLEG